jgi:hypothetical protein
MGFRIRHRGFKNNKDVVLEAVKQDGMALQFASDELKNNKDVVLKAVRQNVWVLRFASEELQKELKHSLKA